MQLESLKIFCDVVRWASFSRGAAENGISQSSASQAVHQLEARLGVKLIDRSKRPLVLTPQGKVYYEGCKDLVERYLELENRVKALEDEDTVAGTVGVAAIYSVGLHHMSRYVKIFEQRHPQANVRLEYLHPSRVLERVTGGEAELGLLSYPAQVARAERDHLARGGDGAGRPSVASLRGPVERRRSSELDGEPFVAFDPDLSIRRAIDRFLRHHDGPGRRGPGIRQHREHQARRRDPVGGLDPARAVPGSRGQGGDAGRRPDRRRRPGRPADPPAGDHPPAARRASTRRRRSSSSC